MIEHVSVAITDSFWTDLDLEAWQIALRSTQSQAMTSVDKTNNGTGTMTMGYSDNGMGIVMMN